MALSLHPDNPHYLLFRGKPAVLITSGEHYGAVLNSQFDYVTYLDELKANDFNLTRIFTGLYTESSESFSSGIAGNTLAPAPGKLLCPWARIPSAANKFDLKKWDEAYFSRLKDFVAQAGSRSIVVEVSLFCTYYEEEMWDRSPFKACNNTAGVGKVPREEVYTLKHPALLAVQQAMVRKIVSHLAEADNVYYEVCNEPYAGGPTLEWEHKMVDIIVATENRLGVRHLVARNPGYHRDFLRRTVENPHPGVSILNFHFPGPPYSAAMQGDLNRAVADDETGFRGTSDFAYRREGWEFILSGGGIFNNLDYSFTVEQPDGTFDVPPTQIGGGGLTLRRQLAILKRFIEGFDFIHMRTDNSIVKAGAAEGGVVQVLCAPGEAYAVYVCGGQRATLVLEISAGEYHAEWVNTLSGRKDKAEDVTHAGGPLALASPPYEEDVALRIVRK